MAVESETSSNRKLIVVRSRAKEVLKAVEPLRENINKFNLLINETKDRADLMQSGLNVNKPDVDQLQKNLKAIIYKLDPLVESVCAMVEDSSSPLTAATASTCDSAGSPDIPRNEQHPSSSANQSKITEPKITEPANPTPAVQIKSAQPSQSLTTRPTKSSAKKPPPGMVKRAPPEKNKTQEPSVTKAFQPDLTKIDTDLMPEQIPHAKLIPKPILWLGVVKSKIPGSVWENLLAQDKHNIFAKEVSHTTKASSRSDSQVSSENLSDPRTESNPCNGKFRFNVLDQLFFENEDDKLRNGDKKTSLADAAATAAKTRVRTVLEPKKTQLIEISIKGLGLDDNVEAIKTALNDLVFDDDQQQGSHNSSAETISTETNVNSASAKRKPWGLTIDRLERLLASYPTPEEANSLRVLKETCVAESRSSGDIQKIAAADRFLLTLLEIKHFQERASACLTRLTFDREVNSIKEKLTKFAKTIDETNIAITHTRPILALIVKMGGLKQVRSIDGATTFLKVIAEHIEDQFSQISLHVEKLASCLEIADINPTDLELQLSRLQRRISDADTELQTPDVNDNFKSFFTTFVAQAKVMLHKLFERVTEVKSKVIDLLSKVAVTIELKNAKWFDDASVALKQLGTFGRDLLIAQKEVIQEKKSTEKKRQRERERNSVPRGTPNVLRSSLKKSYNTITPVHSDQSEDTFPISSSARASENLNRPFNKELPQAYEGATIQENLRLVQGATKRHHRQLLASRKSMPPGCSVEETSVTTARNSSGPLNSVKSVIGREKKNQTVRDNRSIVCARRDGPAEAKPDNVSVVSSIGRAYGNQPMAQFFEYPGSPKSTSRTRAALKEKQSQIQPQGPVVDTRRSRAQELLYSADSNYPIRPTNVTGGQTPRSTEHNYHPSLSHLDDCSQDFKYARQLTIEREIQARDMATALMRERSIRSGGLSGLGDGYFRRHVIQSPPTGNRAGMSMRTPLSTGGILLQNNHGFGLSGGMVDSEYPLPSHRDGSGRTVSAEGGMYGGDSGAAFSCYEQSAQPGRVQTDRASMICDAPYAADPNFVYVDGAPPLLGDVEGYQRHMRGYHVPTIHPVMGHGRGWMRASP